MGEILNHTKWGKRCLLIPFIFTMVMLLFLLSGCNSFLKSSGGTILFISDRVQIEGSEKYPGFQLNNEIYLMDWNGNNIKRLTDTIGYEQCASFSPDGKKIAFASDRDGNFEIYVMNADGSNQVNLTHGPGNDSMPAWSSDGKQIAFCSDRDRTGETDLNTEIYRMQSDGNNLVRLTNNPARDRSPQWKPVK